MLKNWKVQELGGAVALLICGLVLLLVPELALVTIANVIGILVIIIGAFFLIGYFLRKELAAGNNDLIKGLVIVCIGIFICVKSELVVSVLPVVLGIGVVLSGILKLQHAFDLKRMGFDTWVRIGLTSAVNIYRFNCHTESVFNRGMADASCGHRIPFQRCDRPHYNHLCF